MVVTQVHIDTFLEICYYRDGGNPDACLYLTLVGEGGKVCVVFRCQADRCLEVYTEVGGVDGGGDDFVGVAVGDDVGGGGVDEYDNADDFDGFEKEGNHLPSFATR